MSVENEDKTSFCMNCGAKQDSSNAFCLSCGAKVEDLPSQQESNEETLTQNLDSSKDPEVLPDSLATKAMPATHADPTVEFRPVAPASQPERMSDSRPETYYAAQASAQGGKPNKGLVIALIVCSALLLIVLTAVAVWVLKGADPFGNDNKAVQETTQVTEKSKKDASLEEKEDSKASDNKENDDTDKLILFEIWEECGNIDSEIRDLATDFNAHWKQGVVPLNQAENIQYKIAKLQKNLAKVSARASSAETVSKLENLIGDLNARVSVIKEACVMVKRGFSEKDILDLLSRDNIGGVNKYKKDFEENYSAARP